MMRPWSQGRALLSTAAYSTVNIDAWKRLGCGLILTCIDYCNAVLAGLPESVLAQLQRAVRLVLLAGTRVTM